MNEEDRRASSSVSVSKRRWNSYRISCIQAERIPTAQVSPRRTHHRMMARRRDIKL
jgi:hypothetical protein